MDKNRVLFVAFVLVGLFLLLRKAERHVEAPPPKPQPVTAPSQPGSTPPPPPIVVPPTPEPQVPQRITERQQLDVRTRDIEAHLAKAREISVAPDPAKARAACLADPIGTARLYNVKLPPQTPHHELQAKVAAMLCTRRVDGCSAVAAAAVTKSDACPRPPCASTVVLGGSESMAPGVEGCRKWAAAPLFLAGAFEGRTDQGMCGEVLREIIPQWPAKNRPDLFTMCALLAEDYRTGGDSFCLTYNKYDPKHAPANCPLVAGFVKGEKGCTAEAGGDKPSCRLLARMRAALALKDSSRCERDPLCLAIASPGDCSEERFYDTRIAAMGEFCSSAVSATTFRWLQDIADKGQTARELLNVQMRNLDAYPAEERAALEKRISSALAQLDKSLKQAAKLRQELNKGVIPARKD